MKILVVSDSHQKQTNLEMILKKESDCDMIVHLGDGAEDLDFCLPLTAHKEVRRVLGNNDPIALGLQKEQVFEKEGVTLMACHGHKYNVYFGLGQLYFAAQANGARVCLYGHTHVQRADEVEDVLLLNPGAIMDQRYALLYIENGSVRYDLKTF